MLLPVNATKGMVFWGQAMGGGHLAPKKDMAHVPLWLTRRFFFFDRLTRDRTRFAVFKILSIL